MVALMPSYRNLRYDNLGLSGKLYPNDDPEHTELETKALIGDFVWLDKNGNKMKGAVKNNFMASCEKDA
jgi:hypothetical protein